jgi:hypothetical protein
MTTESSAMLLRSTETNYFMGRDREDWSFEIASERLDRVPVVRTGLAQQYSN